MEFDATSIRVTRSLTEIAARATAETPDEGDALALFAELIKQEGLALQPTMGLGDYLRNVLRLAGSRQKIRELEQQAVSLTWLSIHVPLGCSAAFTLEDSEAGTRDMQLCAFGSGLGSQVVLTLSTKTQSGPRDTCGEYQLLFQVKPVEYLVEGRKSVELSVVSFDGQRIINRNPCTTCNSHTLQSNLGRFVTEPFIDVINDSIPTTVSREYELSSAKAGNLGIDIPQLGTGLAIKLRAERKSKLTLAYTLQPGHRYTPYVPIEPSPSTLIATSCWIVE